MNSGHTFSIQQSLFWQGGRKGAESYYVVTLALGTGLHFLVRQSIVNCCLFWCQHCISGIFPMHCTQGSFFNHVLLDVF